MARRRGSLSLGSRLLGIVMVAILPVLGVAAYDAFELRQKGRAEAMRSVTQNLESLFGKQALLMENTRLLLSTLSKTDTARTPDANALHELFGKVMEENPLYVALLAFSPSGDMIAADSDAAPVVIRDRAYYREVLRRGTFTIGEFAVSRTTGKETIHFAYPAYSPSDGGLSCILVAAYDLAYYGRLFGAGLMSLGSVMEVFDRRGVRLYRYPEDADEPIGAEGGDAVMNLMHAGPVNSIRLSTRDFPGEIAASRFVSRDEAEGPDFLMLLRYPEKTALASAKTLVTRSSILLFCSLFLSFVLLRVLTYFGISSQLATLVGAARRYGSGDFSSLSRLGGGAAELVALSASLDEMAMGIESRKRERDEADAALRASLAEKEILLKEIHHRVKNNFQIISSLLNLQAGTLSDPEALAAFEVSQSRIKSMSLIHEKLYQSESLSKIDFDDYLKSMMGEIASAYYGLADRVRVELDLERVEIPVDTAIPLGLILNEIITNSYKYAFPGDRAGRILVRLAFKPPSAGGGGEGGRARVTLEIEDDGIGLGSSPSAESPPPGGLGRELIKALAAQLRGELSVEGSGGTRYRLEFPLEP